MPLSVYDLEALGVDEPVLKHPTPSTKDILVQHLGVITHLLFAATLVRSKRIVPCKSRKDESAAFRAGRTAALEHHDSVALGDVQRGIQLFARASVNTRAYGFPKGACQSGSS
jgi:hypothetical protein